MFLFWKKRYGIILLSALTAACSLTQFSREVTVRKGDTLYSISRKYNVPLRDIIDENHLTAPYSLQIGQRLTLPYGRTHTVRYSETLYSISRKYGITVTALARRNNLKEPYTLKVGQVLRIPGTENVSEPQTSTSSASSVPASKKTSSVSKTTSRTSQKNKKSTTRGSGSSFIKPVSIPKSQAGKVFAWPVKGQVISDFGNKGHGQHNDGINISGKKGSAIKAADKGVVAYAGNELKGYGNLLLIRHADGWITAYAHNDKLLVKKGDKVTKGQKIATMGMTGSAKTPQLHFEIRYKTKVVNPKTYLR